MHEFAEALLTADNIILTDIYAAREQDPGDISSQNLADEINALGKKVYYFHTFEEIESFILKNLVDGDLLITMGAGNVGDIGNHLINLWFMNIIHNLINIKSSQLVVDIFLSKKIVDFFYFLLDKRKERFSL